MRIAQNGPRQHHHVGALILDDVVGLLGLGNHTDGGDRNTGACAHGFRAGHLVAGPQRNFSDGIFRALRAKRAELARARGVPAYVVFPDATLIDIAARKPRTLDEFAGCHGVGAKKLESFGLAFLEAMAAGSVERPHPVRRKLAGEPGAGLFDALAGVQASLANGGHGTDRYLACTAATLARIAETRPRSRAALERIPGVGAVKAERFGEAFLTSIQAAEE
jgi:ATP-dependent DNA helicase RecQ